MMKLELHAPLHDYQRAAMEHVLAEKGNALFLEMGLGKTLTALELIHQQDEKFTLIIAPRRICEQVWRQEAKKWGYPFEVTFLKGSPSQRREMLKNPTSKVYLITPENIIWLESTGLFPFDQVIIDELTKFKSSKSKRWRALNRMVAEYEPLMVGLSGTPAPNGYHDLWAQLFLLDGGKTLGARKGKFLERFFRDTSPDPRKYNRWELRSGAKKMIDHLLLHGGVIAQTAREVLGQREPVVLPDLHVELTGHALGVYEELQDELMATMPDGTVVLPEHEATVQMKLRQVASGFMLDEAKRPHILDLAKIDTLAEYVEEMDGEPLLVVYTFQQELRMIRERMSVSYLGGGVSEKDADRRIALWNNRELPVLCVQPAAAGHGLNLQMGGHHILFYSTDWNLETYQQVIGRLNRQGQQSTVFVRHMSAGPVEEQIHRGLARKAELQKSLMEGLQSNAKSV